MLSKLNFALGFKPKIEKSEEHPDLYIPKPYKAVCLISADFELAWAFRFSKSSQDPVQTAKQKATRSRKNIPQIIELCEKYNIPITWATVGHLFLENCTKENSIPHPELKRLPKAQNKFWDYSKTEWFDADPCSNYKTDPEWYAPDLIEKIIQSPVKHEIGCHTFSHIDCKDSVCPKDVFISEIEECNRLANNYGITMKSFVHPGHQIGNIETLSKLGFTSFRTDYGDTLAFPNMHPSGIWELKNTAGIEYRDSWSIKYHIKRINRIINRAIKHKKVCVLWFHPSFNSIIPEKVLPEIFEHLNNRREDIWITTHKEYIDYLNTNFNSKSN